MSAMPVIDNNELASDVVVVESTENKSLDMIDTKCLIPLADNNNNNINNNQQHHNNSLHKHELVQLETEFRKLNDSLDTNYETIESKINRTFETLKLAVNNRQKLLLDELKLFYNNEKTKLLAHNELNAGTYSLAKFDFQTVNSKTANVTASLDVLNNLINSYGKILVNKNESVPSSGLDCSISGKGLKQCYVNEESSFTLTFKNRDALNAFTNNNNNKINNVSFLDIFILTSDGESFSSTMTPTQTTSSPKSSSSARLATPRNKSVSNKATSNCDCLLEALADGRYAVKYKLSKKGIYVLNILVNKKHIGNSPYRLVCLDNSRKNSELSTSKISPRLSTSLIGQTTKTVKAASTLNVRSAVDPNKRGKYSSRDHSLGKNFYQTKSTSSASLLLPSSNGKSYSRSTTPSVNPTRTKQSTFLSSSFTNGNQRNANSKVNNHNNNNNNSMKINTNTNNDDSMMSSAPSIVSDSLSSPISPALSKTNISNLINFNELMLLNNDGQVYEDDFLYQIGRRGRGSSEFMNPQAVCATNDNIYVTDSNNQKIDVFSHNGDYKFTLGANVSGTQAKLVRRPIGIDATVDGRILVVDYECKCVNVYEENGRFISKICQGKLLGPKGVSINKAHQNQIVIADSKANSVCVFDADGKFLQRFGNLGNKNENFAGPQYVSCMSNGDIVVSDFYNHCLKVYDFEGKFKFSFGSNGSGSGQFNGPTGVSTDSKDNIIVVDWGNCRIQVFDKHGVFVRYVNSEYNQLYGPQDVAIINNTIAVADSGNHCVKIFEYS